MTSRQIFRQSLLQESPPFTESFLLLSTSPSSHPLAIGGFNKGISQGKATVHQITDFFLYVKVEKALSVPAIKDYCVALSIISSLRAKKLAVG